MKKSKKRINGNLKRLKNNLSIEYKNKLNNKKNEIYDVIDNVLINTNIEETSINVKNMTEKIFNTLNKLLSYNIALYNAQNLIINVAENFNLENTKLDSKFFNTLKSLIDNIIILEFADIMKEDLKDTKYIELINNWLSDYFIYTDTKNNNTNTIYDNSILYKILKEIRNLKKEHK